MNVRAELRECQDYGCHYKRLPTFLYISHFQLQICHFFNLENLLLTLFPVSNRSPSLAVLQESRIASSVYKEEIITGSCIGSNISQYIVAEYSNKSAV